MVQKLHAISAVLNTIGATVLFLLMILTAVDVSLRYVFNSPVQGTFELTELVMVVTIFFALAYTQSQNSHVSVELLVDLLPQRAQGVIDAVTSLLSFGIIAVIIWQGAVSTHDSVLSGEHSALLKIPLFYFKALIPLGALMLDLEILITFFHSLKRIASK